MTEFQSFQTERLSVEAIHTLSSTIASDLGRILTPSVTEFLPPRARLAHFDGDVAAWLSYQRDNGAAVMFVKCDGLGVGLVMLHNGADREAMIGYMLAQSAWGRGYASELILGLVAMLRAAGFQYAFGGVADQNPASCRALEKAGFDVMSEQSDTKMFRIKLGSAHA